MTRETLELVHYGLLGSCLTHRTVSMEPNQIRLIDEARGGSAAAFEALVRQHKGIVWSVCLRITGNAYDAEDALQDALISAWRGIAHFRGDSGFATWLYKIAANAALGVVRARSRAEPVEDPEGRVERDFAEQVAASDLVQRALQSLPKDFRVALVLRELCDFTYEQIAAYQGIGVATVKTRISRGRQGLRAALESLAGELATG